LAHLSDTTGVIRDWAIGIDGETERESRKHTEGSKSNTEHIKHFVGHVSGHSQNNGWDNAREISESKTEDDVSGGTSLT
jgi:hypothetical protein